MIRIITIFLALVLSGCANMTPGQKTAAWVAAGVVITAIAVSASDNGSDCKPTIGGSGADFDFRCRPVPY